MLLQFLPAAAFAGDREFNLLVDRVSAYYQKRPLPFMGLLSFIGNCFTPHGVGHLQMAIFEGVTSDRRPAEEELESSLEGLVGPGYQPFVRVYNSHSGERTFIYAREFGKKSYEMLIVSMERTEAVIMQMRIDPDALRDWVDEPVSRGRDSAHGGGTGGAWWVQHKLPTD